MRRVQRSVPTLRTLLALVVLALVAGAAVPASAVPHAHGVRCSSAAGVWRARSDKAQLGIAETITVKLESTAAGLVGTATTEYWTGRPGSAPPAVCGPGMIHRTLDAPMAATLAGTQLSWWVTDENAIVEHTICGLPSGVANQGGGSFGTVDLVRGTFEARFDVHHDVRPLLYLHISCS